MAEVKQGSLQQLVRDLQVLSTASEIAEPPPWHDGKYAGQGWRVTLRLDGRSMEVKFWMGSAHVVKGGPRNGYPRKPKTEEVLDCLLFDASSAGQTFEDWVSNYGYDADSRKAYATWEAIEQQTLRLKLLLGSFYEQFLKAERL